MNGNEQGSDTLAAIVLAGQRNPDDPLLRHTGAGCKALVEMGGTPMLLRVLTALRGAKSIGRTLLSGPTRNQRDASAALGEALRAHGDTLRWHEPQATPSTSAFRLMQSVPLRQPVLITSADHPFLSAELVELFCERSLDQEADVTIGLAPYRLVKDAFPEMKKTVLHFSDGEYCGCNLFAFLTPEGRRAADYWRQVESARKSPFKVIRILGWLPLLRYRFGLLSLPGALNLLSRRFGLTVRAVILPHAEAAIDVDTVEDYEIVQREFTRREAG